MTHIPGHIGTDNTNPLVGLENDLSGETGFAGAYTNQVYLGDKGSKEIRMKRSGKTITLPAGDKTLTTQQAKALYLTDPNVEKQWLQILQRNGLPADKIKARAIWDLSVDGASDWYATSNGKQKITPEQYLGWYAGSAKKAGGPSLPSRQVYQYAPEQLAAKTDETAQSVLGRAITEADKTAPWYKDLNKALNKMVMQGTVTTSKKVRNPQTGKMERVVIQKPEVTTEAITQQITGALTAADPVSAQRQKNLEIENWFLSKMQRGNQ
jgi:hypothetical protein